MTDKNQNFQVPDLIATKVQVIAVAREAEKIHEEAVQGHVRKEQTGSAFSVTKPTKALNQLLEINGKTLSVESLKYVIKELDKFKQHAPTVRVILSGEPDDDVKAKLVKWFRSQADKPVLLRFGIQPGIAGGAVVYTPNHRYDFSLRRHLTKNKFNIGTALKKLDGDSAK